MNERRDPQPDPGSDGRIVSAAGRLTPIQQAWSDYVTHGLKCPRCRSIDAGKCDDAERLHRAYQEQGDQAYQRLADETP
jgi:hypothetical protein